MLSMFRIQFQHALLPDGHPYYRGSIQHASKSIAEITMAPSLWPGLWP